MDGLTRGAFADINADRDGETLYAEVKGRTTSTGLDIDTPYGRLLRRIPSPDSDARFAVLVPGEAPAAAVRVQARARPTPHDVYTVDAAGPVAIAFDA